MNDFIILTTPEFRSFPFGMGRKSRFAVRRDEITDVHYGRNDHNQWMIRIVSASGHRYVAVYDSQEEWDDACRVHVDPLVVPEASTPKIPDRIKEIVREEIIEFVDLLGLSKAKDRLDSVEGSLKRLFHVNENAG